MTIELLYGHPRRVLRMHATRRYLGEQILARLQTLASRQQQLSLRIENILIPLAPADLRLAAEAAAAYHNQICYNIPPDDGWMHETAQMEQAAEQHMLDPPSDDSDDNMGADDFDRSF